MANNPNSSYQTKIINLLKTQNNRGSTPIKDTDYLNVYIELTQNKTIGDNDFEVVKRPGTFQYAPADGTNMRGIYYNQDFQKIYWAAGTALQIWDAVTNTLNATLTGFFATGTGDVGFTDYLYENGQQVIIITDGTTIKQLDASNTVTVCTDPDLPQHQPYPIFLDGYLFVLKVGSSDLYNSNLNNPLLWTAGDFITSEIQPDQAIRPAKLNNYIVVFGTTSIEYFWDAGITSGSPLQRNDTPVKFNGYLGGFAQWGNKIYFVGNNVEGQPTVYMLEDLKMESMDDSSLTRYFSNLTTTYTTYRGNMIGTDGHIFYLLNAGSYTYVCDLTTKQWGRWAYAGNQNFDMGGCINIKTRNTYRSLFYLGTATNIYQFSPSVYNDNGAPFTAQGVTDNQMFDTMQQKVMNRLIVWSDRPSANAPLFLSWSDDDYQTFSTPISIELNQERPSAFRLGRFRRRAFKWSFTQNQPMRFKGLEVEINLGSN